MAMTTTDNRQRLYKPIDVYSADGEWIDEPTYNKERADKPVMMGNWLEEERLNSSMEGARQIKDPAPPLESEGRRGKKVNKAPNLQSSVFLTSHEGQPSTDQYQTSYGTTYKGDQQHLSQTGSRKAQLERQILAEATERFDQTRSMQEAQKLSGTQGWESEKHAMDSLAPKLERPYVPAEEQQDYLNDMAITAHGDIKATGATPATGDNPYKRNTNFTTPIGTFVKGTTPAY